jgi:hypothetical protein
MCVCVFVCSFFPIEIYIHFSSSAMHLTCVHVLAVLRSSSCTLAAKIFEYNYEVAHLSSMSLSSSSFTAVETDQQPDLKTYLKEYERLRWLPTTSLTVKAAILGERPNIHPLNWKC